MLFSPLTLTSPSSGMCGKKRKNGVSECLQSTGLFAQYPQACSGLQKDGINRLRIFCYRLQEKIALRLEIRMR